MCAYVSQRVTETPLLMFSQAPAAVVTQWSSLRIGKKPLFIQKVKIFRFRKSFGRVSWATNGSIKLTFVPWQKKPAKNMQKLEPSTLSL